MSDRPVRYRPRRDRDRTPSVRPRRVQRRRRSPKWPALGALAVVALIAVVAGTGLWRAQPTTPSSRVASSAETTRVAQAHPSDTDCAKCHEAPAQPHYSADCTSCHAPRRSFSQPQLTHVTFGAHSQATQACSTCHAPAPDKGIACRTCHGNACGKKAKSAADCLDCHRTGTTSTWVP